MDFSELIIKMVIFVALMLVGYVGARRRAFSPDFAKGLSKLVMNVFISCTILNSVMSDPPALTGAELARVMAALVLMIVISYVLGALAVPLLRLRGENAPVTELLISVMNNIFIGLPLVQEIYGAEAVLYCALSCIPYNVLLYTYGVWRLKSGSRDGGGHMKLKDAVTPPLIATVLALMIFVFKLPVPRLIKELISTTSAATMPLSMIVIGATLGAVKLQDAFRDGRMYVLSFLKLAVSPALVWLALTALGCDGVLLASCVIFAACPSGVIVSVLALQYGYDASYSSKGVLVTTVLSMLTLPLAAYILA